MQDDAHSRLPRRKVVFIDIIIDYIGLGYSREQLGIRNDGCVEIINDFDGIAYVRGE